MVESKLIRESYGQESGQESNFKAGHFLGEDIPEQ